VVCQPTGDGGTVASVASPLGLSLTPPTYRLPPPPLPSTMELHNGVTDQK
jgi:hypothetical protein